MHGLLTRRRDERGAVAIIVAISLTAILIVVALVLDFGLVRVDRQIDKSGADSAVLAGLQGLNGGDANPRPFAGVCTAISYLQRNNDRFSAMTSLTGTWSNGADGPLGVADPCSNTTYLAKACVPGDNTSWAKFSWTGTMEGKPLNVVVQSGYVLSGSSGYSEDSLPASSAENDDSAQGCDQLAVLVNQQRAPGLGSLATSSDLKTSVRSVGRVKQQGGGYAPALLLLQRTGCSVGQVGSVGSGSYIHVLGKVSTNNLSQPGTIHSDSDGTGCSGSIFLGKAVDGIVAYGAPTIGSPTVPDPTKPGSITTYGGFIGLAIARVRDAAANVYAASGLNSASPGTHTEPTGRARVTRRPVDERYLRGGVDSIINSAQSNIFGPLTSVGAATTAGYATVTCSGPGAVASVPAYDATKAGLYVSCGNLKSMPTPTGWRRIVFSGEVSPSATLSLQDATEVYIVGGTDAITLGSGNTFSMHTTGHLNVAGTQCTDAQVAGRAKLVIKSGGIKQTAGTMRLCNTTMIMMGGRNDGCVPATDGSNPTLTPCNSAIGSGQIKQTGGVIDWTAPNVLDVMTLANGDPDPTKAAAWKDPTGPEDLALWSESGANSSSTTSILGGGGGMHVQGVFMAPNWQPLTITGGAHLDLTNAQFISTALELNGATNVNLSVDPNAAVTLPKLQIVGLVR